MQKQGVILKTYDVYSDGEAMIFTPNQNGVELKQYIVVFSIHLQNFH